MKMNDTIARVLKDLGVEQMFGVIGDVNLFVVDRFMKEGGRYTSATTESAAVLMASGYAQVTGRTGVATVTCGPGLVNSLTPIVEAVKGHVPMVIITGDSLAKFKYHPQSASHREFVLATGAAYEAPARIEDVARDLAYAFQRAWAERRPVVFNFPSYDLQWEDVGEYQAPRVSYPERHCAELDSEALELAVGILATARRPIVLAGYGVVTSGQAEAVARLARRLDAPLMTTLRAKDLFRGEPANLGVLGISGREEVTEAVGLSDCIVSFGASLHMFTTANGTLLNKKRLVMVVSERGEVGRTMAADATVLGEPGAVAERMLYWIDEAEIAPSQFASEEVVTSAVAAIAQAYEAPLAEPLDAPLTIQEALIAIEHAVEPGRLLVTDGGRFMRQPWQLMRVQQPRHFIAGNLFGAIGTGIGYAIGAAVAERGMPTVAVVGDGGFMLGGLTEFHTAVREKLDFIVVLCNDGGYGAEYLHFTDRDMDPSLALFDWPEFSEIAQAMGGQGLVLRTRADLAAARQAIRERRRDRPLLIDLKLDPRTMPRTF
ncbi:thiamine pyrophosphate-binding protein [Comamonas sp. NLF-1-9]|uniref:thiamine pyrophosphate-binding protein n=1 Tax=Comamonas sp. NLF-1-9 TaxID=2853163 RepID=UPI001C468EA2|nr:thiamine pyrophosphate-binding protein [Comamonas sp. NLF-1-9]QXL83342.1 thiamine pyrophosphate-binding protein [Comamonas sp. NLF-1-9]